MNVRCVWGCVAGALLAAAAVAQEAQKTDLSVSRVAIFSSGVAFFECEGQVTGDEQVDLSFRTDQINDILKSLVVQDFDGGAVNVVNYASRDPIDKTLQSFAVDITGKPTLAELLDQLRGEPVHIAGPRELNGVIVGVEETTRKDDGDIIRTQYVNILTDAGMQTLPIHQLTGIELTNEKTAGELRKALETLAQGRDADKKTVTIKFLGEGPRRVRAMYLLEAPIWKTSYRLVLAEEDEPFLQGWATVENATEEDWDDVWLTLVSGRPISFRMDLYTPIYIPRPLMQLDLYASLRPPTFEYALDELESKAEMADGAMRPGAAAPPGRARGGRMLSRAGEAEAIGGGGFAGIAPEESGVTSVAQAGEAGELFKYEINEPVSIARQRSAMLPIVTQEIEAEKLSIYNQQTADKHPVNGLRLTNSTGLSLMQGPITVFDGGTYAGDAMLPDLQPGEERLVAYALDLKVEVTPKQDNRYTERGFKIYKGTLQRLMRGVSEREYLLKNKDAKPRTVLVEVPAEEGWELVEPEEPSERTASVLRFKVDVPGDATEKLAVRFERLYSEGIGLSGRNLRDIELYMQSQQISQQVKDALARVVEMRQEIDRLTRAQEQAQRDVSEAVSDQERVRRNLETLDKNTDQYARQLEKFSEYEEQIESGRKRVDELTAQIETARRELDEYLKNLTVE